MRGRRNNNKARDILCNCPFGDENQPKCFAPLGKQNNHFSSLLTTHLVTVFFVFGSVDVTRAGMTLSSVKTVPVTSYDITLF